MLFCQLLGAAAWGLEASDPSPAGGREAPVNCAGVRRKRQPGRGSDMLLLLYLFVTGKKGFSIAPGSYFSTWHVAWSYQMQHYHKRRNSPVMRFWSQAYASGSPHPTQTSEASAGLVWRVKRSSPLEKTGNGLCLLALPDRRDLHRGSGRELIWDSALPVLWLTQQAGVG